MKDMNETGLIPAFVLVILEIFFGLIALFTIVLVWYLLMALIWF
jgi:hypothetical protein